MWILEVERCKFKLVVCIFVIKFFGKYIIVNINWLIVVE